MDTAETSAPTQQAVSYLPSHPPALAPAGYFPPTARSHNPYASGPYLSHPSQYQHPIPLAQTPFASSAFNPQTYDEDVPTESLNLLQRALDKVQKLTEMADPLSVVASVLTVTAAAVQVSQTLYKLVDTLGGTNSEIEYIALEVDTFSGVLEDLGEVLDNAEEIITTKALKNANTILSKRKDIFEAIRQMLAPYKSLHRLDFWNMVQWTFRRERVKPMRCRLETLKTTLLVWLGTVKLAQYRSKLITDVSASDKRDRKYLSNVETSIMKNKTAIVRWKRAEAESDYLYNRNALPSLQTPHNSTQSSKEIRWISHLVPFASSSHAELWRQPLRLENAQQPPDVPKSEARTEFSKTVNLLLAKWTTLNPPNEGRVATMITEDRTNRSGKRIPKATGNRSLDGEGDDDDNAETGAGKEHRLKEKDLISDQRGIPPYDTDLDNIADVPLTPHLAHSRGFLQSDKLAPASQNAMHSDIERLTNSSPPVGNTKLQDDEALDQTVNEVPSEKTSDGTSGKPKSFHDHQSDDEKSAYNEDYSPDDYVHVDLPYPREIPDSVVSPSEVSYNEFVYPSSPAPKRKVQGKNRSRSISAFSRPVLGTSYSSSTEAMADSVESQPTYSFGGGSFAGFAPTIPGQNNSGNPTLPHGSMQQPQHPYIATPYALPYPHVFPYGMPMAVPPAPAPSVPVAPTPASTTDNEEIARRVEAMLAEKKKERDMREEAREAALQMAAARRHAEEAAEEAHIREIEREAVLRKAMEEAVHAKTEAARSKYDAEAQILNQKIGSIKFKDAVGNIFTFPLKLCRTWDGMEELIRQSFMRVGVLGPYIGNENYDLLDPGGEIILPQVWEDMVEPGWTVTMHFRALPAKADITEYGAFAAPSASSAALKANSETAEIMRDRPLSNGRTEPRHSGRPITSKGEIPPRAPRPPVVIIEEKLQARRPPQRRVRKQKYEKRGNISGPKSDDDFESSDSEPDNSDLYDASGNGMQDAEPSATPWQEALWESSEKLAEDFQSTWESIMQASRAKAQREILKIWLKESPASSDKYETQLNPLTPAGDLTADLTSNDRRAAGQLQSQLPLSGLRDVSDDSHTLEEQRPVLASNSRVNSKPEVANILVASHLGVGRNRFCKECQSPLSLIESKDHPNNQIHQPTESPTMPAKATAHNLLPQLHIDRAGRPMPSKSMTERLQALEKIIQQQKDDQQSHAKAEMDEERLARLETTLLQHDLPATPPTPRTEPEASQSQKLPNTLPISGSSRNGKGVSSRPSIRARLFGRSPSSYSGAA